MRGSVAWRLDEEFYRKNDLSAIFEIFEVRAQSYNTK